MHTVNRPPASLLSPSVSLPVLHCPFRQMNVHKLSLLPTCPGPSLDISCSPRPRPHLPPLKDATTSSTPQAQQSPLPYPQQSLSFPLPWLHSLYLLSALTSPWCSAPCCHIPRYHLYSTAKTLSACPTAPTGRPPAHYHPDTTQFLAPSAPALVSLQCLRDTEPRPITATGH